MRFKDILKLIIEPFNFHNIKNLRIFNAEGVELHEEDLKYL